MAAGLEGPALGPPSSLTPPSCLGLCFLLLSLGQETGGDGRGEGLLSETRGGGTRVDEEEEVAFLVLASEEGVTTARGGREKGGWEEEEEEEEVGGFFLEASLLAQ